MRVTPKRIAVISGLGIAAVVALAVILNVSSTPGADEFAALDTERRVIDASTNVYDPLTTAYTVDYANVFTEQRSMSETDQVKEAYVSRLERERDVNTERLRRMAASPAARDADVKQALAEFVTRYQAVVDYYDQETTDLTNITRSVAGPCGSVNNRNFVSATAAKDYTKAADACLASLAEAKKGTDKTTTKLLTSVEAMIKERRDKFNQAVTSSQGLEQSARTLLAVISLLDINTELKTAQTEYETEVRKEYTELVNQANSANAALEKAIASAEGKKA